MGINKKIAVLSGKGGTGKTLVAVNLAAIKNDCYYLDCDVEEPNGHLFFKPEIIEKRKVNIKIPKINYEKCVGCKACVEFCNFNALAFGKQLILFSEICHSCGGCSIICPYKAITEVDKTIGSIEIGAFEKVKTVTGMMNIGEASGVPIIKEMQKIIKDKEGLIFIDCPPGSSCIVMECVKDCDYCLLIAEPTIFGAHNLEMIYELVRLFKKPCGVVLNKCTDEFNPSENFCKKNLIEVLAKIPFDKNLGKLNSDGKIAVREQYEKSNLFFSLLKKIKEKTK